MLAFSDVLGNSSQSQPSDCASIAILTMDLQGLNEVMTLEVHS